MRERKIDALVMEGGANMFYLHPELAGRRAIRPLRPWVLPARGEPACVIRRNPTRNVRTPAIHLGDRCARLA